MSQLKSDFIDITVKTKVALGYKSDNLQFFFTRTKTILKQLKYLKFIYGKLRSTFRQTCKENENTDRLNKFFDDVFNGTVLYSLNTQVHKLY